MAHASGLLCSVSWPNLFLVFYARYVDDLFSLDEVEEPELASEFIGPTGTATLARRVIQELLGWELDAEKAVKKANVFVALGVQVEYVDRSQTMIARYGETSSQVAERVRRLLDVTVPWRRLNGL